jgi:hypothetical protein
MTLSLTHLGESILSAMINQQRDALFSLPGVRELMSRDFVCSEPRIAFPETSLCRFNDRAFDGACRIDVAVLLKPDTATAFELKLGDTRLSARRVNEEWLVPCGTSHGGQRWKGNVMAVLDQRFSEPVDGQLTVTIGERTVPLTREWFVVARRETLDSWQRVRPNFSRYTRLLAFEDMVESFGGEEPFNRMVREMLDVNFYREWVLRSADGT